MAKSLFSHKRHPILYFIFQGNKKYIVELSEHTMG